VRRLAALLALSAGLAGCRAHLGSAHLNSPLRAGQYHDVSLGHDGRREVLARLGPPDAVLYTLDEVIFDYRAGSHRSTDVYFYVPSDLFPGPVNPVGFIQGTLRFFFSPFEEVEEFRGTAAERMGRGSAEAAAGAVPFARGLDVLTLRGRQIRYDRLRVVLDRRSGIASRKSLRLATGEYVEQSIGERMLLLGD
jgi:hypothetical protein